MEALGCTLFVLVLFAALCVYLALRCDKPAPMPIYREAAPPIIPPPDAYDVELTRGDPIVFENGCARLARPGEKPAGYAIASREVRRKLRVIR